MRVCGIPTCPNSRKPGGGKKFPVTIHVFPSGPQRALQRQLWVETFACVTEEKLNVSLNSRGICACHFTPYDYTNLRLNETAIPTQNLPPGKESLYVIIIVIIII